MFSEEANMYKIKVDVQKVAEAVTENYGSYAKAGRATGLSGAWFGLAVNNKRGYDNITEETFKKLLSGLTPEQRKKFFKESNGVTDIPDNLALKIGTWIMSLNNEDKSLVLHMLTHLGMPRWHETDYQSGDKG
jgi:hypothetical protein